MRVRADEQTLLVEFPDPQSGKGAARKSWLLVFPMSIPGFVATCHDVVFVRLVWREVLASCDVMPPRQVGAVHF